MEDLFPQKQDLDYTQLQTTPEGSYSITRRRDAERILRVFRIVLKELHSKTITDATACIGGDTLNFASVFKSVWSIELNKDNFNALENNVHTYGFDNVHIMHGDSTKVFDWFTDVLYIDPPWGGPDYRDQKNLDLQLSGIRLDQWIESILLKKNRPSYIFIKLPSNYNFKRFNFISNVDDIKAYRIRSYVLIAITVHKLIQS